MTTSFTRKEMIEQYLTSNFQGSYERNECAKEMTKFNKANSTNKITTNEIIEYAFPTFYAYLLSKDPSIKFENNFRRHFGDISKVNGSSYEHFWTYFSSYCMENEPVFKVFGNTYKATCKYFLSLQHSVVSSIKLDTYKYLSLLRD